MKFSKVFTIKVNPAAPPPTPITDITGDTPDETVGVEATGSFVAVGGVSPVSYAVTGGSLPPGVSLDSATGLLSGVPTAAGVGDVEITATDSAA